MWQTIIMDEQILKLRKALQILLLIPKGLQKS